ncbi:inorganic pyrophosphatase [Candidatus Riesia sp. GBBU]|nr:inorganic pyrophosphatase [Candidatus Riesia sp. GBBU]
MNFNDIPSGKDVPNDIYAIVEISSNSDPVKYEIKKNYNAIFVDRFIPSAMFYPCNYGYINKTKCSDGDPIDILVKTPYPVLPGSVIQCRPVGVLKMYDESGKDFKIISVPSKSSTNLYNKIQDIDDISSVFLEKIYHFFQHYKDLEKNKTVRLDGWGDIDEAKSIILSSLI